MTARTATMTATVTALSPLRVRVDGAHSTCPAEHTNTVFLTVGARVEVAVRNPLLPLVIGTADAASAPAGGSTFASAGATIAEVVLTSDGAIEFTNIPWADYNWRMFKLHVTASSPAGSGVGNHNLVMRINGMTDARYRFAFAQFTGTGTFSTAEQSNWPAGRLSEGAYRSHAEITIQCFGSWPVFRSLMSANWGATGTYSVFASGVYASSLGTPVTSILLYNHLATADGLSAGSRATLVAYK